MASPLEIFCDESGLTGPNLLDPNQRLFTYAGVAMGDGEAWALLADLRRTHSILDDELKAKDLLKTVAGKAFILDILQAIEGRYSVVAYDKATALCAKLFEYVYEPVFQDNPDLLYAKNLHRFVTMYCYTFLVVNDQLGGDAVRQFLAFMRSYDPAAAPLLFSRNQSEQSADANPFEMITSFANGYRRMIVADNQSERDAGTSPGTLTLDLTSSALFSLMCHFGAQGRPLAVTCDENPQLERGTRTLTGGQDDPGLKRARRLHPDAGQIDYTLARPIAFEDSRNRPALQVADIVAGTASSCGLGRLTERGLQEHLTAIDRHLHPHCIFPDYSVVRLTNREAMVNWVVLFGLGDRGRLGQDPYYLLEEIYEEAERAWDRGELRPASLAP
ncbi:MAG: DUF3800 domain-containing protein [Sphingomonas pseudosanguinis]|uniref:DUF3800 domain-containing protein n=1 Tax=Sphingomonas pseudosanguinis TaxID=413712 RepID=UPI00391AB889